MLRSDRPQSKWCAAAIDRHESSWGGDAKVTTGNTAELQKQCCNSETSKKKTHRDLRQPAHKKHTAVFPIPLVSLPEQTRLLTSHEYNRKESGLGVYYCHTTRVIINDEI